MTSNSNLGFTGYLLRKTIQPNSLRRENSNFNDYRETNMLLYINKKVADTRQREGKDAKSQELSKGISLVVRKNEKEGTMRKNEEDEEQLNLDIQALMRDEEKQRKDPFYKELMESVKKDVYQDDFAVVSKENKMNKSNVDRKKRNDVEKTLNQLVTNNIDQQKTIELFRDYKKVSLKDKLNELKNRKADMAKIQRKIKKDQDKAQGQEDLEKINNFMEQICTLKSLTIGKVLNIKEEDIEYQTKNSSNIPIPKAKALQMLEELMEDQEEENEKNLIKIFKKSQLDNIDSDAARNKFNMTSFKKKNEKTEKLFKQMAQNNKSAMLRAIQDPYQDPQKFIRNKNTLKPPHEKINVFKRLEIQQSTSPSSSSKLQQFQILQENLQTTKDFTHNQIKQIYFDPKRTLERSSYFSNGCQTLNDINNNSVTAQNISTKESIAFMKNSTQQSSFIPETCRVNSQMSEDYEKVKLASRSFSATSYRIQHKNFHTAEESKNQLNMNLQANIILSSNNNHQFDMNSDLSPQQKREFLCSPNKKRIIKNPQSSQIKNDSILDLESMKRKIQILKEKKQAFKAKQLKSKCDQIESLQLIDNFVTERGSEKNALEKQQRDLRKNLKSIEEVINEQMKEVSSFYQGEQNVEVKLENQKLTEYLKRAEFKRKLINYLIQKVNNKGDVYSKFMSKQFVQNFLQKLTEKDQSLAQQQ